MKSLCTRAKEILLDESNVQVVESPVTVSREMISRQLLAASLELPSVVTLSADECITLNDG